MSYQWLCMAFPFEERIHFTTNEKKCETTKKKGIQFEKVSHLYKYPFRQFSL